MRFAYADPPYLGSAKRLYASHHPDAAIWDEPATHLQLVADLAANYDGAALSCLPRDLALLLPACPPTALVAAWVKPFGSGYKPGQRIIRAWEPVIYWTPRTAETAAAPRVRDTLSANATRLTGLPGAKPPAFNRWILALLGVTDDDEFNDLFPGSGGMARTRAQTTLFP